MLCGWNSVGEVSITLCGWTVVHKLGVTIEHFKLDQNSLGCSLPESWRASCYFSGVHEDKAVVSELADARTPSSQRGQGMCWVVLRSTPRTRSCGSDLVFVLLFCETRSVQRRCWFWEKKGSRSPHFPRREKTREGSMSWNPYVWKSGCGNCFAELPKLLSSSAGSGAMHM